LNKSVAGLYAGGDRGGDNKKKRGRERKAFPEWTSSVTKSEALRRKLCLDYLNLGSCVRGDKCSFKHVRDDEKNGGVNAKKKKVDLTGQ
jgi:hypothetical protein